jgi:hypothetical protein
MGDLLGEDYSLIAKNALYRCLDMLLARAVRSFARTLAGFVRRQI